MDTQAPRENSRNESDSAITVSDQAARQVCERSGASGQRQTIARAEQPEDEQSPQRNRRNL